MICNNACVETSFYVHPAERFRTARQRRRKPTSIVIHEPVLASAETTFRALNRKGLGVHFMVDEMARVTQHADPVKERVPHLADLNARTVGIELVNPYMPDRLAKLKPSPRVPWRMTVDARWAHGRRYVVPSPAQLESLSQLVEAVASECGIPLEFGGVDGDRFQMRSMKEHGDKLEPGIWAHRQVYDHADGGYPAFYCFLRLKMGYNANRAYEAARLAAVDGARRKWLKIPGG